MLEEKANRCIDLISLPKKSFWKLSIPIAVFLIFNTFYSIVDMMWVTSLSMDAAFAVSASAPLLAFIATFGDSIGQGTNSIMSRYIGSKDYNSAYNSLIHGIIVSVIISVLFLLSLPFIEGLFYLMMLDNSSNLIVEYLTPLLLFSFIFIFINVFCETFQVEGNSKTPVAIMIASNILNLILDPIFIYWLHMGVSGAAYASVISQFLGVIAFIYLYLNGRTKVPLSLKYFKFRFHIVVEILKVALPNFIDDGMVFVFAMFINEVLLLEIGSMGIVLYAISIKIRSLLRSPIKGMSRGLMSVTGHLFGAKKIDELNEMYIYVLKYTLIISLFISISFFVLRENIYESFSVYDMETSIFYIGIFGVILTMVYPFTNVSSKMLDGFGKSYYSLFFTILRSILQIILIVVLGDLMPYGTSVLVGITIGEVIFSAIYFITLKLLFRKFKSNKDTLVVT